jgi:hypothetical protein
MGPGLGLLLGLILFSAIFVPHIYLLYGQGLQALSGCKNLTVLAKNNLPD